MGEMAMNAYFILFPLYKGYHTKFAIIRLIHKGVTPKWPHVHIKPGTIIMDIKNPVNIRANLVEKSILFSSNITSF